MQLQQLVLLVAARGWRGQLQPPEERARGSRDTGPLHTSWESPIPHSDPLALAAQPATPVRGPIPATTQTLPSRLCQLRCYRVPTKKSLGWGRPASVASAEPSAGRA